MVLAALIFVGGSYLLLIYSKIQERMSWPVFNIKLFTILFLTSFVVTLAFSRMPYVVSFLDNGMYETRLSGLGGGGWYSYFAILFYPLSIILAFINISSKLYYNFFVLMMILVMIDLVVLGTRGAPFFVLLFHTLMLRINFFSVRSMVLLFLTVFLLLLLVDYQTQARSLNTLTVGWDWVRTIQYSWIFDNLKVKDSMVSSIDDNAPSVFPLVYLLQYLTHSIAEFKNFLFDAQFDLVGSGLYLQDEICLVVGCARQGIQAMIADINPRVGLYQTLYSSLFFDFGVLGVSCLAITCTVYLLFGRVSSIFIAILVYFGVVLAVSGVENYIYNGLGLARLVVFIVLWKVISLKIRFKRMANDFNLSPSDTKSIQ